MSGKRRRGSSSDLGNAAPAIPPLPMARMRTPTSMSIFGYQEIFLRVMSFLSPTDLAMVQGVSRDWAKMSLDPQLWKRLYLERYPHPHQSRLIYKGAAASSTPSRSMRPIARMPSRAFPPPSPTRTGTPTASGSQTPETHERKSGIGQAMPLTSRVEQPSTTEMGYGVRNDGVDWKMMLRLGTNWSNGNALSETSVQLPPSPAPSSSSGLSIAGPSRSTSDMAASGPPAYSQQHIALFPSFIATSNPTSPLVHVHRSSINATTAPLGIIPPPPGWSSPHRPDNVTSISADQSVVLADDADGTTGGGGIVLPARLGIFYQSGGFAILRITLSAGRLSWSREAVHPPHTRPQSVRRRPTTYTPLDGDPIVLTAIHYPLVITCTLAFHLSFYTLTLPADGTAASPQTNRPVHIGTMHSDVSFHPAALSLLPVSGTTDKFRAALTYCTPLYPYSWTVAVQEFSITVRPSTGIAEIARGECWHVGRGDEDEPDYIWPKKVRPVVGVKGRPVGVGTDGRWAVLAGEDNQIQVYSLPTSSTSSSAAAADDLRSYPISHSHTLLAHSAAITSISLASGRVVSGGRDGRVLVWELDEDLEHDDPLRGRTVAYVEVKPGGRRPKWRGAAGPDSHDEIEEEETPRSLPHPQSISSAARSLFLPRLPEGFERRESGKDRDVIRQLAFDEEKIVGLVREGQGEVMKVWGFNG